MGREALLARRVVRRRNPGRARASVRVDHLRRPQAIAREGLFGVLLEKAVPVLESPGEGVGQRGLRATGGGLVANDALRREIRNVDEHDRERYHRGQDQQLLLPHLQKDDPDGEDRPAGPAVGPDEGDDHRSDRRYPDPPRKGVPRQSDQHQRRNGQVGAEGGGRKEGPGQATEAEGLVGLDSLEELDDTHDSWNDGAEADQHE